jgi:hypothetical protein
MERQDRKCGAFFAAAPVWISMAIAILTLTYVVTSSSSSSPTATSVTILPASPVPHSAGLRASCTALSPTTPAADGCAFVYLDVGTNIGVQFHKLYDRDRFPEAGVKPIFDEFFGNTSVRDNVCSWGWEPNPAHQPILNRLVKHYTAKGYRVSVSHSAAGNFDGHGVFKSDGDLANKEWASHVEPLPEGQKPGHDSVEVSDVSSWILHNVVWRTWPGRALPPGPASAVGRVVMKIDAEGSDESIFAALVRNGALCGIDIVYTESHVRPEVAAKYLDALTTAGCSTRIIFVDDESYRTYELPPDETPPA